MTNGWEASADAWITDMGERGDFGREFVLDGPMMGRVRARRVDAALDVGCGEGRFCRMLRSDGIETIGVDPTAALVERARALDPDGDYRVGRADALELPDVSFDLVVSYVMLVDVPDLAEAIAEMARVLRPGGALLIANMTSFASAAVGGGWQRGDDGEPRFGIDNYLEERAEWVSWRGITILNWHRPMRSYMSALLANGLVLRHFDEPSPTGGDPEKAERYRRVPWFVLMEWEKPRAA